MSYCICQIYYPDSAAERVIDRIKCASTFSGQIADTGGAIVYQVAIAGKHAVGGVALGYIDHFICLTLYLLINCLIFGCPPGSLILTWQHQYELDMRKFFLQAQYHLCRHCIKA